MERCTSNFPPTVAHFGLPPAGHPWGAAGPPVEYRLLFPLPSRWSGAPRNHCRKPCCCRGFDSLTGGWFLLPRHRHRRSAGLPAPPRCTAAVPSPPLLCPGVRRSSQGGPVPDVRIYHFVRLFPRPIKTVPPSQAFFEGMVGLRRGGGGLQRAASFGEACLPAVDSTQ